MSLHHFTHPGIDGEWHAVYRRPTCGSLVSIGDSVLQTGAQDMADAANRDQARRRPSPQPEPGHHRIPRGFYTDEDAA